MCGLLRYSLYCTRDAAQNWEDDLATTLSSLKLTRGCACSCVWRGHIKRVHIVATVHGDDITRGGLISSAIPHQNDIEKVRDQEASDREDPDLEKS